MPKKMSQDEVIEKFKLVHGNKYDYSKVVYTRSKEKVDIVCAIHGDFSMAPHNHILGQGCRACGYIVNSQKRSLGLEEFLKRSKEVHGDKYDYSKVDYTSSGEKVLIGCKTHGFFEQIAAHHMNGHGCSSCWHETNPECQKMTTEEFVEKAKLVHGDKYEYSNTVYTGNDQQVLIVCRVHGEYSQRANDHLSKKAGCPACAGVKKLTNTQFVERATALHEGLYTYENTEYTLTDEKVWITCKEHGDFLQRAHDHLNKKAGCPKCVGAVSKVETELFDYVKAICPDAVGSDRVIIKPLELDIAIPSKNIAFEFNGLYFHSSKFKDSATKHKKKSEACKTVGYRLVHIYEDDWRFNRTVVEKTINHILGVTQNKYQARKLVVSKKSYRDVKDFYIDNHIQGSGYGDSWCLLDGEDIVAAMQFSQASSERGNVDTSRWELIRYATVGTVAGGASRLFAAFVKDNPEVSAIISYSDNDLFDGGMYQILGFSKVSDVKPDYKYIVNGKREHKSNFRKSNIAVKFPEVYDENLSESEMTEKLGYFRIYNSGLTKWEWSKLP